MLEILRATWPLLFGVVMLFLGTGMQHTLIVLRASAEGFSTEAIGWIQAAYQIGWLIAALSIPRLIGSVGHVRVFAAVTSVGSAIILCHLLLIEPLAWALERAILGICTAGLMVVAESWLNDISQNESRAKTLGLYTILSWGAPVLGVYLLRFGDVNEATFFLLASVAISIGAVPILLSASRSPLAVPSERLSITKLYQASPLAVTGTVLSGASHGALFASVSLYTTTLGLSVSQTSNAVAIALGAGIFVQYPLATLSDKMDRRVVLAASALLGAAPSLYFAYLGSISTAQAYVGISLLSIFSLGLYSQCLAHANDHIPQEKVVAASATLVLLYGLGFAFAPVLMGYTLEHSPAWFFAINGGILALLFLNVLYRMSQRDALVEQGEMVAVATASPYSTVVIAQEEWGEELSEPSLDEQAPSTAETASEDSPSSPSLAAEPPLLSPKSF